MIFNVAPDTQLPTDGVADGLGVILGVGVTATSQGPKSVNVIPA